MEKRQKRAPKPNPKHTDMLPTSMLVSEDDEIEEEEEEPIVSDIEGILIMQY